jgi:triosephosphate isomerase (TIM)
VFCYQFFLSGVFKHVIFYFEINLERRLNIMKISFDPQASATSQSFGINKDRQPIVAGNWKCNKTSKETLDFIDQIGPSLEKYDKSDANKDNSIMVKVLDFINKLIKTLRLGQKSEQYNKLYSDKEQPMLVIAPSFLQINDFANTLGKLKLFMLGAQNGLDKHGVAHTGEVSMEQLTEKGVKAVIIGHSERRANDNETDENVNLKVKKALEVGLVPIACVGETNAEWEAKKTEEVISRQVTKALSGVGSEDVSKVVIAYEPVWAIGKGATPCSTDDADKIVGYIRNLVRTMYLDKADKVRILYGGNANPENIADLMIHNGKPTEIDGALIGGAALVPEKLASMYDQTAQAWDKVKAEA